MSSAPSNVPYSSTPSSMSYSYLPVEDSTITLDFDVHHGILGQKYEDSIDFVSKEAIENSKATRCSSFINLLNTIVGAGMLGLPYAFAKTGWILGSVLLLISSVASVFSLHVLSVCALKTKHPASFYSVTEATIPQFTFLIDLSVVLQTFGVGIGYLIVIGGLMPAVQTQFGVTGFWASRETWVVIGFAIVAPLSCLSNLDALRYTSFFAIICVLFLTSVVLAYAIPSSNLDPCGGFDETDPSKACVGSQTLAILSVDTFRVFSIFIFAFCCQQNVFAVVNEMKSPTVYRIGTVIWSAIGAATIIYAVVAMSGYSTYGSEVTSNILTNYPNTPLTSATRIFVSLLVAFSYPLQCHPSRGSALTLWRMLDGKDSPPPSDLNAKMRYIVITALYLFGTFGIAMVVSDLGVILALVGATGATIVAYILPGISYYVLHKDNGPSATLYGALALFFAGLIIMPVCVIFIFI